ncbi:glycerophosphodiester phosphodiesterase [Glaciecola sp. MH2013]|uniref:glycerophosphodiester phosphodiesterase n=1 Tax=Glaciecola sp. MH2013 TaxID=2785524 RepID=UPI00189E99E7|nr:glycerophosphodiester phosphodiesterase [Glaciecola sp. MH2013]MBF7071806.1 glycerophosphodiester phosphodiesterase [Glaciecola sp. MH2013]
MLVIAHRGFSSSYTENTLVAFTQALLLDIDAIELDVHQVGHEFMVFHDPYVDKLTNGTGRIFDKSLEEVRSLLVKERDPIPTLSEIAALVGEQVTLNIELKTLNDVDDFVAYVAKLIDSYRCKVVISSFDHRALKATKSGLNKSQYRRQQAFIQYGALVGHCPLDLAQYAEQMGMDIAAIDWNVLSADFVDDAHARGLKVWSYTVNHLETLNELLEMGVDGIFTDRPDWAREIISANK